MSSVQRYVKLSMCLSTLQGLRYCVRWDFLEHDADPIQCQVFGRTYEASNDLAFRRLRELLNFFLQPRFSTSIHLALTFFSPPWVSQYLAFPLHQAASRTSVDMENLSLQLVKEKRDRLDADPQIADLASHMIRSGHFTDYEIASQLLTYMIAG